MRPRGLEAGGQVGFQCIATMQREVMLRNDVRFTIMNRVHIMYTKIQ